MFNGNLYTTEDTSRGMIISNLYHFKYHILNGEDIIVIGKLNKPRADARFKEVCKTYNLDTDKIGYYRRLYKIEWPNPKHDDMFDDLYDDEYYDRQMRSMC